MSKTGKFGVFKSMRRKTEALSQLYCKIMYIFGQKRRHNHTILD